MLEITDKEFGTIRDILYRHTGVALKDAKKPLVVSRLRLRLEELKLARFLDYIPHLEGRQEQEIFINALTTNETFFFRHTKQFNYLYESVLPEVLERKKNGSREVRVWSAASSTGEEPYSLAIVLKEFFKAHAGWKWTLLASDINTEVIAEAKEAIFSERSIKPVPDRLRSRYFSATENNANRMWQQFKLSREVVSSVKFIQHNLLQTFAEKDFDIIFIRNVMIYFDNASKQRVVDNMLRSLVPGGFVFISLSENLNDVRTDVKQVFSAVYQRPAAGSL